MMTTPGLVARPPGWRRAPERAVSVAKRAGEVWRPAGGGSRQLAPPLAPHAVEQRIATRPRAACFRPGATNRADGILSGGGAGPRQQEWRATECRTGRDERVGESFSLGSKP